LERAADRAADHAGQAAEQEAHDAAMAAVQGAPVPALTRRPPIVARQDLDAGPADAGVPADAGAGREPAAISQVNCVIRLGGCVNTRPAGIPTAEEIASYNTQCRGETAYAGPDVTPTDDECRNPPSPPFPGSQPGAAMICSKRLQAPVVGWFANHAYIDDTGRGDCHGSGLLGNYAVQDLERGNFVKGCAVKTDTSTDPQQYTPNIKPCDPRAGVGDVHVCLRDAFNAYTDPSEYSNDPRRRPWGPNSNTFAATLAAACCADASDSGLGWVPGWDHAPAGPCPESSDVPAESAEPGSPDAGARPNSLPAPSSPGVTPTCKVASGPAYTPSGNIPPIVSGGRKRFPFSLAATFTNLSPAGVLPSCCSVRQYIQWDQRFVDSRGGPPHSGFPSSAPVDTWIEDRDKNDKRYGHRSGPHSDPIAGGGDEYTTGGVRDQASGDTYDGRDTPQAPVSTKGKWQFRLDVIDTCNSDAVKGSSSVITVDFG
jgi:hypothetical protein